MPIEIKNLSIKINIANDGGGASSSSGDGGGKKKALKKDSVIKLVEQMQKLKNER